MGRDGTCDVRREGCDGFDGFGSSGVFEYYTEFGERVGDFGQVGEEMLFGVEYGDILDSQLRHTFSVLRVLARRRKRKESWYMLRAYHKVNASSKRETKLTFS